MAQNIYLLTDKKTGPMADHINDQIIVNGIFESDNLVLTEEILLSMASQCMVEYFYVITTSREILFSDSAFKFKPPYWDSAYVHMWNNDPAIRLFNAKLVRENPGHYTDESLKLGKIELKELSQHLFSYPDFDIIFLSYDEFTADENFNKLLRRFPRAKRINGVKGICEAHKSAARISETSMFFVVDADAQILPTFDFKKFPAHLDINTVYVWHSRNPVNNLEYGYGGIKLFPKHAVLSYEGHPVDFTTSVADYMNVIEEVANITCFNTDAFSAWRSAFRECVKLSTGVINGQLSKETEERLNIWCSVGQGEFANFVIAGANAGRDFGTAHKDQPDMLRLINDFGWLEKKFNS